MCNIAHHHGLCRVLHFFQFRPGLFVASRQQRDNPGVPEIAVILVEPHGRRCESRARDVGELHRFFARRPVYFSRGADGNGRPSTGQQVNALIPRLDERVDIQCAGEPRAAIAAIALVAQRRAALINGGLPACDALVIYIEVFGRVAGIGIAPDDNRCRMAVGSQRRCLVGLRNPAAQRHRHTVGKLAFIRFPRPDITMLPGRRTNRIMLCGGWRL